jgi:hypothetical protein
MGCCADRAADEYSAAARKAMGSKVVRIEAL